MLEKFRTALSQIAYGIYGLLFGFVFYAVVFNNTSFEYDSQIVVKYIAIAIFSLCLLMWLYSKFFGFLYKYRYIILTVVCIVVFIVQYNIGNNIVHAAIYDHGKVLNGAMLWSQGITGEEFTPYSYYIHYYTNNIGLFMIQQLIFKIATFLGFTNLYTVAIFTGHILFAVMIITSFIYLDENISGHRALFFLFTICMFPPLYFQSSISYTDTWSVWVIPCLLLSISRGTKTEKIFGKIMYALFSAVLLSVGTQIKATVAIVAVALFIQTLIHNFDKKNIAFFAVLLACFVICNAWFTQWTYSTVRDKNRDNEAMPLTHWLMMGLQGDGAYNGEDEHRITLSVPPEQRVEKNMEVINQRLTDMGVDLFMKQHLKTVRTSQHLITLHKLFIYYQLFWEFLGRFLLL